MTRPRGSANIVVSIPTSKLQISKKLLSELIEIIKVDIKKLKTQGKKGKLNFAEVKAVCHYLDILQKIPYIKESIKAEREAEIKGIPTEVLEKRLDHLTDRGVQNGPKGKFERIIKDPVKVVI